jgi:hypothetical protein
VGNSSPKIFDEVVPDRRQMLNALGGDETNTNALGLLKRGQLRPMLRQLRRVEEEDGWGEDGGTRTGRGGETWLTEAMRVNEAMQAHEDEATAETSVATNVCHVLVSDRFNNQHDGLDGADYVQLLTQSVFTLCPSGSNEETYRVWEALEAGSIPVVKRSRAWKPLGLDHPLYVVESWDELPRLLEAAMQKSTDSIGRGGAGEVRSAFIDGLQAKVARWWRDKKASFQAQCARQMAPVAALGCAF